MTPPPPILPQAQPKRKVSDLIARFESPTTTSSTTTSTNLLNASTSTLSSSITSKSFVDSSPSSELDRNLSSKSSNSILLESRIKGLPSGRVSNNVRKFSLELPPKALLLDNEKKGKGKEVNIESNSNEIRRRVGQMDWSSRPRDTGELRKEARTRLNNEANKKASISSTPSASTSNHIVPTLISTTSPTPMSPSSSTPSNSPNPFKSITTPLPVSKSNDRAKLIGLKAFKPGRIAPLPPTFSTSAPTILIPATVSTSGDGGKTRMNIEQPKKSVEVVKIEKPTTTPSIPIVLELPPRIEHRLSTSPPPPSYLDDYTEEDSIPLLRPSPRPVQPPSFSSNSTAKKLEQLEPHSSISYDPSSLSPSYNSKTSSRPIRPNLNQSISSQSTTETIRNLPAATIFKSRAEKLILPDLDKYLDSSIGNEGNRFSDPDTKGLMSNVERESWEKWLNPPLQKKGFFTKLFNRNSKNNDKYLDLEKEKGKMIGIAHESIGTRSLIFPPMHLIPKDLTVTDLKMNRMKIPFLGSLDSLLGIAIDGVLAAEGSAYGIKYETVESFRDLMQIFTLYKVSANGNTESSTSWFHTLFVTVPRVISLDFVSAFGMTILWMWVFSIITALALYEFYRITGGWKGKQQEIEDNGEGFDRDGILEEGGGCGKKKIKFNWRNSRNYKIFITFLVTSLYLPLSKISIGALAWTSDYWILNPYNNTLNDDFPTPPPLGPSNEFYDPLDFCYRTTMLKPNGFKNWNWSFLILPVAILTVMGLTIWLPWRIHKAVQGAIPRVDPYTELGEKRKDIAAEYTRLLAVDRSPYSFLYQAYRRPWASFKAIYMLVKLVNILLVVLITKNNCIFREYTSSSLIIIRQSALLGFMTLFLLADVVSKPFVDMISNNSDRVSRIGFVALALLGLLVALNVPFKVALAGPVTIAVDIISYSFNVYFSIIGTVFAMSYIKRLQFRLDFSLDIFSPHLDISKHVSRRIWQETWSALLLAAPEFKMPPTEHLNFTDDDNLPPYLLNFKGTQAERHIENLKVLRGIGLEAYSNAMRARCLPKDCKIVKVRHTIQEFYTGPDIIWHPINTHISPKVTSFFGRLDVSPFSFTAVFKYDQDPVPILITDIDDLELLIRQNESPEVRESRRVRLALRSLEGHEIFAPHSLNSLISKKGGIKVESRTDYQIGRLIIIRNSKMCWRGYNFSSGFQVKIIYNDGQSEDSDGSIRYGQTLTLNAEEIGIPSDFHLSTPLATLLRRNREIIETFLPKIDTSLTLHREYFFNQSQWKTNTLSHSFLFDVVGNDSLSLEEVSEVLQLTESDSKVQLISQTYPATLQYLNERRNLVSKSRISQFWYLFFDDLWRSNKSDVPLIRNQPDAFSPHYRTSICYRPMSRGRLEDFLKEHSLFVEVGKKGFFNSGFLNRIYFYLNEITFESTSRAIPIHLGSSPRRLRFDDLEHIVPNRLGRNQALTAGPSTSDNPNQSFVFNPSLADAHHSYDSGHGTDHDTNIIRPRKAFTFEEIFDAPQMKWEKGNRWEFIKDFGKEKILKDTQLWLGLTPFSHNHIAHSHEGVTFDLRQGSDGGWKLPRSKV